MDRLRFLLEYPYIYALIGGFLLFLALVETLVGEAMRPRRSTISRNEDPKAFRSAILWTMAIGVFFIGYFAFLLARR